ncbi:MAG TPA: helix-turn-helix domain-containing protein [Pseudonocardiaceae bacterium]|nr:helix-turn-helix domain-containing protein [Pseudonocardiaceae bacterium]
MTDRTGAGDPARTLRLLWRDTRASGRGPRPGLTVDGLVAAAIEVADGRGLAAVTMRRVARSLGVAPMSLYTYVPGNAELLDLMLDAVYARMSRTDLAGRSWRAQVTAVAPENGELFRRHPWAAMVSTSRRRWVPACWPSTSTSRPRSPGSASATSTGTRR